MSIAPQKYDGRPVDRTLPWLRPIPEDRHECDDRCGHTSPDKRPSLLKQDPVRAYLAG